MKKIALISDGWKRLIVYAWVEGIMQRIRELGEDITLYQYNSHGNWSHDKNHNAGEYNIYNLPDLEDFDGIILDCSNIIDIDQREYAIELARQSGLPVVAIDFEVEDFYCVSPNNIRPIVEVMRHMYDHHGCRSFAFAGGPKTAFSNHEREQAYRQCIAEFGLSIEDNPVFDGDYDFETGEEYIRMYRKKALPLPDVFICANDNIAAGVCAEAEKHGISVPGDLYVTGFDNLDKARFFRPQLTTVTLNRENIGALCLDILLAAWRGEQVEHHSFMPTECIYAESCGCENTGDVEYREYVRDKIIESVRDSSDDAKLMEFEARLSQHDDLWDISNEVSGFFSELDCDGMYFVADRRLLYADTNTSFPTEGFDEEELGVIACFERGTDLQLGEVSDLYKHIEETASQNAYLFSPVHFRRESVGYIILKNARFLYENSYYYDILSVIIGVLETQYRQNQINTAMEKLKYLYNRDPLTGIYNRIAYSQMIAPAFAGYNISGITCAIIFVDADNFKHINDTFGHEFGDKVLIKIAATLSAECPKDGYVCRFGGDEFIAFFPNATKANTKDYIKRVRTRLEQEHIKVSIGYELTTSDLGVTMDDYLGRADDAMYKDKEKRKATK